MGWVLGAVILAGAAAVGIAGGRDEARALRSSRCSRRRLIQNGVVMPAGDVETFHQDGAWHNRVEGEKGTSSPFKTKAEAVDAGREQARRLEREHIIRNENGQIGERNSYGHDPRNIPG
ncbi:DUF2188 domain-containing protein [Cnuibacter physcomitrellae]|nr:DUF2188 domain-containing protein [Cnuibacter physcomitrellae]